MGKATLKAFVFSIAIVGFISKAQETRVEGGVIHLGGTEGTERSRSDYYWEVTCGQLINEASQEVIHNVYSRDSNTRSAGIAYASERNGESGIYVMMTNSSHFVPLKAMNAVSRNGSTTYYVTIDNPNGPNILVDYNPSAMSPIGPSALLYAREEEGDVEPAPIETSGREVSEEPAAPDVSPGSEPASETAAGPPSNSTAGTTEPVGVPRRIPDGDAGPAEGDELSDVASDDYTPPESPLYRSKPVDDHQTQNALIAALRSGLLSTGDIYQGNKDLLASRYEEARQDPSIDAGSSWWVGSIELDVLQYPSRVRRALCHCENLHQVRPTIRAVRELEVFKEVKDQLNCGEFS